MLNIINPKCLRHSARCLLEQQAVKSRVQHIPCPTALAPGLAGNPPHLPMGTGLQSRHPSLTAAPACLPSPGYSHRAQLWAGMAVTPEPHTHVSVAPQGCREQLQHPKTQRRCRQLGRHCLGMEQAGERC